jgi:hypothetical protein
MLVRIAQRSRQECRFLSSSFSDQKGANVRAATEQLLGALGDSMPGKIKLIAASPIDSSAVNKIYRVGAPANQVIAPPSHSLTNVPKELPARTETSNATTAGNAPSYHASADSIASACATFTTQSSTTPFDPTGAMSHAVFAETYRAYMSQVEIMLRAKKPAPNSLTMSRKR